MSRFTLHGGPVALASTDHSLWVVLETPSEKAELVRLDPASGRRMASYSIGRAGPDFGAATSVGDVVYASAGNHVIRVDALHPSRVIRATVPGSGTAITVSAGSVWVASISENQSRDAINRLDARTLTKQAQIPLSFQPISLNAGLGSIWLASTSGMWRINPLSNRVSPMNVAWEHPVSTAVSSGRLWVIQQSTLLVGIDRDGRIRNRNELPFYPGSIAASKNELWVTNNCGCKQGVVTLIDSTTGKVEGTRVVGETPVAVTTDPAGDAWVATFADGSVSRVVVRH